MRSSTPTTARGRLARRSLARPLAAAAVTLAALATAACGGAAPGGSSDTAVTTANGSSYGDCKVTGPAGTVKLTTVNAGTLTVAGDLPSPGWWNGDTVAQIKSGFEYCLAANIAHRAGLNSITVRNVSFDALVAGKSGGFDLAMAEISITPDRAKVVDFSSPYFDSNIGVLAKPGAVNAGNLRSLRIGVKQATSGQSFVQNTLKPEHPASVYPGDPELLAALKSGRIDAALTDTAILLGEAQQSGGSLQVVGQYKTGESYGALLPKGSANDAAIDQVLAQLKADGTLDALSRDYLAKAFGGDPARIPMWQL